MGNRANLDLYQRLARNRMRLAAAVAAFTAAAMSASGLALWLFHASLRLEVDLWLLLLLTWLLGSLYVVLRYALGGSWILKGVATLPRWRTDRTLEDAVMAAALASGMTGRVRLFEIPDEDINAFSVSLPDGTFAIFATRGVAHKLPHDERVAILAHEIAHMQAGDTTIYTAMIRLAGRRSLQRLVKGLPGRGNDPLASFLEQFGLVALAFLASLLLVRSVNLWSELWSRESALWFAFAFLLALFAAALPPLLHAMLRVFLDRERDYHADLEAVFLTRDPEAVYGAVKAAAEDVRDVMILPSCFDALLFHPVVDYSSYRPFCTQPTMADRLQRLREAFPALAT